MNKRFLFFSLCSSLLLCSCASMSPPRLQPEVSSLVVANQISAAADRISAAEADYGKGNYLLYYLDRGLIELMAGRYDASITSFEKAKARFRSLYTQSVSAEAMSWIGNDYALPYRGSDYEYVLVNVLQAMNYIAKGNIREALVEARDLDAKYQVILEAAQKTDRRHIEDNGFARFFMGILYEAGGTSQDLNDALLSYKEAAALYQGYYGGTYMPDLLRDKLAALAAAFNDADGAAMAGRHARISFQDKKENAEVYVFQLVGYSPVKEEEFLPVPVEGEIIAKLAFPHFVRRAYITHTSSLAAVLSPGVEQGIDTELGADIEDIAIRDLDARKALVMAKAVLRPALKYLIERKQKESIEKKHGQFAGDMFAILASLYNLYSDRADLRSWQALPAQIRVGRLVLRPGQYHLYLRNKSESGALVFEEDLGEMELRRGETRFLIRRASP